MEDFQIVELYFERSQLAIHETSEKYGAYLSTIAYNILRDASDTEEIVNDTYIGAWNSMPPTKPENLKLFLSRITRNLSFNRLDYILAGKRRCTLLEELDECVPDNESCENVWEAREIGRILNGFLAHLDRKNRNIFVARYYYAYTMDELAQKYSLSPRQIKYVLSKTRKKLRACLDKEGVAL